MSEIRIVEGRPAVLRETIASKPSPFGALLRQFRQRNRGYSQGNRYWRTTDAMSQLELARLADVDGSYVSLLERGLRPSVAREVVLSFATALTLTDGETDRLLFAAGLAPERDYQSLFEDLAIRHALTAASARGERTEAVS
jgi:transcriptional regulator with XRE-family HTH domain